MVAMQFTKVKPDGQSFYESLPGSTKPASQSPPQSRFKRTISHRLYQRHLSDGFYRRRQLSPVIAKRRDHYQRPSLHDAIGRGMRGGRTAYSAAGAKSSTGDRKGAQTGQADAIGY